MDDKTRKFAEHLQQRRLQRDMKHENYMRRANNQIFAMLICIMILLVIGIILDVSKRVILKKDTKEQIQCLVESDMSPKQGELE